MYLQTDERADVAASLKVCFLCLESVRGESALWKWVILSLHNALQGAMVCHLSDTAQLGALTTRSAEKKLDWHGRDRRGEIKYVNNGTDEMGIPARRITNENDYPPDIRLADAKTLFERLYNENERQGINVGEILEITENQQESFQKLHDFRNDFSHFTPKGWSIELEGLPQICLHVVDVLDMIEKDPWPFRHMNNEEREGLRHTLSKVRNELERLKADFSTA